MALRMFPPPRPALPGAPVRIGFPLALLLVTQPIDVLTTAVILGTGVGHEGNPLTLLLLRAGGFPLLLVVKLALVGAIGAKAFFLSRHRQPRGRTYLMGGALAYTAIVGWNAAILVTRLIR